MRRIILLFAFALAFCSCEKNLELLSAANSSGVEFYLSKNSQALYSLIGTNYAALVDTISVEEQPFILYDDILLYDSATYTFTLRFSKYNESFTELFKDSKNFIITVDREPVMFGFLWSLERNQTCPYVYLIEPYEQFDSDNANELKLHFGYPTSEYGIGADPRNHPRLIDRLRNDGKLRIY